jgi:hypothetical protein
MTDQAAVYKLRHIFAISDGSGRTCSTVVQAALSQFKSTEVRLKTIPNVLSIRQIEKIILEAASVNGVIIYTVVSPEFRRKITELGRLNGVPTVDILGPVLTRLSDLLDISPLAQPGLFRQLDDDYYSRIEALDYTIKHDDGLGLSTLGQAELVLLGVSRTTKTPVSIYLSYRGWKVANIPVLLNRDLPEELKKIDQRRVVALTINPEILQLIRLARQRRYTRFGLDDAGGYTNLMEINRELDFALEFYSAHDYPIVNVTHKSIEETSTEIMRLIYPIVGNKKNRIV